MTAPNAELAYRVLDQIDADPQSWDQGWWFTVDADASCGTAACFAGWACKLAGDVPDPAALSEGAIWISDVRKADGSYDSAAERAQDLLGITFDQRGSLFAASNSRETLGRLVAEIFGPRPVDWEKPLEPVMGVPASGCDCSHDGGHGLSPWPDRSRGHAEDCPAYRSPDEVPPNAGSAS